jgi:DNA polymerase-1
LQPDGEENMIKAFLNNEDIHKSTVSKVFDVSFEEVTREQRSHAKQ